MRTGGRGGALGPRGERRVEFRFRVADKRDPFASREEAMASNIKAILRLLLWFGSRVPRIGPGICFNGCIAEKQIKDPVVIAVGL